MTTKLLAAVAAVAAVALTVGMGTASAKADTSLSLADSLNLSKKPDVAQAGCYYQYRWVRYNGVLYYQYRYFCY